ncbi:MAG: hypothetical protein IPM47_12475 [Sphingobacteriales bacterium]|nr:MAG: hypothetical protein IPM47_12475 [Sphingobacteriales bacterium]
MDINLLPETLALVGKDLNLTEDELRQTHENMEQFRIWLANQISYKMETDMEALLQAMYRLDISETKAMQALTNQTEQPPALALADLVIEREIQKINTRRWYKSQQSNQDKQSDDTEDIIADSWD